MQCQLNSTSSLLSHIRFLSAVWVASKGTAHPVTHIPQWFPSSSNYVSVLIETLLVTEEKDLRTSSTTYNFCAVRDRCIYFVTKNTATENIAYKFNFSGYFDQVGQAVFQKHLETSALHYSPNEENRKAETMTYALSDTTGCCVLIMLLQNFVPLSEDYFLKGKYIFLVLTVQKKSIWKI